MLYRQQPLRWLRVKFAFIHHRRLLLLPYLVKLLMKTARDVLKPILEVAVDNAWDLSPDQIFDKIARESPELIWDIEERFRPRATFESTISARVNLMAKHSKVCNFEPAKDDPEKFLLGTSLKHAQKFRLKQFDGPEETKSVSEATEWLHSVQIKRKKKKSAVSLRSPIAKQKAQKHPHYQYPKCVIFTDGTYYCLDLRIPEHLELSNAAAEMTQPLNPFVTGIPENDGTRVRWTPEEAAGFILTGESPLSHGIESYVLEDYFAPTVDAIAVIFDPHENMTKIVSEINRAIDMRTARPGPEVTPELNAIRASYEEDIKNISNAAAEEDSQKSSDVDPCEDDAQNIIFISNQEMLDRFNSTLERINNYMSGKQYSKSYVGDYLLLFVLQRTKNMREKDQFELYNRFAPPAYKKPNLEAFRVAKNELKTRSRTIVDRNYSFSPIETKKAKEGSEKCFVEMSPWWHNCDKNTLYDLLDCVKDGKNFFRVSFDFNREF